jgi:cation diffusion facilitator family transporter
MTIPSSTSQAFSKSTKGVHSELSQIRHITIIGLIINIILSVFKFVVGHFTKSQALVADAIHSLSDCTSDLVIIVGAHYWNEPADRTHQYGHKRIETLVSMFIGLLIGAVGLGLLYDSYLVMDSGSYTVPSPLAAIMAGVSILGKEGLYRWTIFKNKHLQSSAVQANAWHHRTDAISSIPVLIAVLVANIFPSLYWADTAGTVVVSLFLLHAAWEVIKPGFVEILDTGVSQETCRTIEHIVLQHPQVNGVHDLRTRSLGGRIYVDLHMEVDPNMSILKGHEIVEDVMTQIKNDLGIFDVLIHLDPYDDRDWSTKNNVVNKD